MLIMIGRLKPNAKVFFDEAESVFTQAQVDAIRAEALETGRTEAQATATAEAERLELQTFRNNEASRTQAQLLTGISTELQAEDVAGATTLNPDGISRFASENQEELKGLKGKDLIAKVNSLKDVKGNKLFFSNGVVNASGSLLGGEKGTEKSKVEYYPGTSIQKR